MPDDDRLDPDERVVGVGDEGDAVALESVPLHDTFWFVWFAFRPDTVIAGT